MAGLDVDLDIMAPRIEGWHRRKMQVTTDEHGLARLEIPTRAGGDTTVRGYEEDRLKTEIVWSQLAPYDQGPRVFRIKPQGANIRMLMNLEIMFPIWKVFSMPILGVLFFDAGALTNSWDNIELDDFKTSIGAALRLVTPVGFISLEYAVPFQPTYGTDPTGRTHFNFGFIF